MVKVKCRNCNKEAESTSFKLHYKYQMMVCPDCFSGRTERQQKQVKKKEAPPKPPGWDQEDEYLEKISRMKKKENVNPFRKIPGTDHVMCKCASCKYEFRYNPFKKTPRTCPFCCGEIPKLRTFNLL